MATPTLSAFPPLIDRPSWRTLLLGVAVRKVLRGARWPDEIAVEGGRITEIGSVVARPGDEVIACDGGIVTAGLVNTHHHLFQWLTRGRATSCDLFGWLQELYPFWARISVEAVSAAATVGLAELALSGATTVADHHYVVPHGDDAVFDAIAEAGRRVGVRLHLSRGSMDLGESAGGLPPDEVVESTEAILSSTEAVAARLHDGDRISVVVAPCSPFTVTAELMVESAALARRLGLRLHTHLAETIEEERDCLARLGRRPVDFVEELGWLERRRLVRSCRPPRRVGGRQIRGGGRRRRPLPELECPAGCRPVPGS